MIGPRLAFSWLTVLPVRGPDTVDRDRASIAIAWAPVVGVVLGLLACGALWLLTLAGASSAVAGVVAVGVVALATRGMHLDGLADTVDGLGSYGPPERAREIMKSGGAGPFGVAAIVFAVGVQAFSLAALADADRWFAVVLAVAVARVAVVAACRRGIDAAPGTGFGALVAGTQSTITVGVWGLVAIASAFFAVPEHRWLGPIVVVFAAAVSVIMTRHCVRRFGGLSGDVLGAVIETTTALTALGFSLGY
ncbi:adenosylcobinamide-GDP ribazoletransferase [Nocardia cyriacigeorgica]|uniref:Adenosylcobinamide-GDP ribazoletransferase n=1 Tax=Nocardia cyriacigeorgica TaxID=135487 RepID=A0A6P1DBV4_9NOCA|nr:adenosylcobinamide-GDP ribazoletransferase [Nocardia cyriacigeorgica]NEW41747.1 adenosylcobinamide-GDP ribazoletransferase [Nocardia cyriacigeorgica]NEW47069.1 adenosylcobinamide-GDP ribazoletransferase [Nocardia cyriacigeorgica]NEW51832.1 adenosylcobinamide-GDP ribazoletransferase [Nocardia cyriacigeorgica]NEW58295.1 adenosylcobinamide-GDP ribazoletransferase [Nocardia cyriacigeorgica]